MVELADTSDSKSGDSNIVWVQVPLSAPINADMVKLEDTLASGASAERCAGSSPVVRTKRWRAVPM